MDKSHPSLRDEAYLAACRGQFSSVCVCVYVFKFVFVCVCVSEEAIFNKQSTHKCDSQASWCSMWRYLFVHTPRVYTLRNCHTAFDAFSSQVSPVDND